MKPSNSGIFGNSYFLSLFDVFALESTNVLLENNDHDPSSPNQDHHLECCSSLLLLPKLM